MTDQHVCTIYIKAPVERVWQGLTDSDFTARYFHSTKIESTWEAGADVTYYNQDGSTAVKGTVLASEYPTLLSFTWHVHYDPEAFKERPSRVTFELTEVEDATRLILVHDDFEDGSVVLPNISKGWIAILSNLKTLLETGDIMAVS
jgi:uncharacterized protein YndB with AHSA1/START domain